jgi:signal transduction histidine kinase
VIDTALSEDVRQALGDIAAIVHPGWERLEREFVRKLSAKGTLDGLQVRALRAITTGAAARFLGRGCGAQEFQEEVAYQGRRLAKLNMAPGDIANALAEYERILAPVLRRRAPGRLAEFDAARGRLRHGILLILNNAYYQVRETETQAFYEMFWAELESRRLDSVLDRFLSALAKFCKSDQAQLYLADERGVLVQRACDGAKVVALESRALKGWNEPYCATLGSRARGAAADPSWTTGFATVWSVPLMDARTREGSQGQLAGLFQFAFSKPYDWLPRERELLVTAAERCRMAIEKQSMVEHLDQQQRQIRKLAEGMMHVEEAERRRISRELHDQTGQDLLWIRLQMEMIEQELPEGERQWRTRLSEVRDMTERTIVEVRRLIAALSPAVLEQLGLAAAIRQLVNRFRQNHPCKIRLHVGRMPVPRQLPEQVEVVAYRLLQECLNNIAKHSACSNVNVSVGSVDGLLRLAVDDDGVGFRVEDALAKPGSFGLAGIHERVALLGGACRIESSQASGSSGTKICVELPLPQRGGRTKTLTFGEPARGRVTAVA